MTSRYPVNSASAGPDRIGLDCMASEIGKGNGYIGAHGIGHDQIEPSVPVEITRLFGRFSRRFSRQPAATCLQSTTSVSGVCLLTW